MVSKDLEAGILGTSAGIVVLSVLFAPFLVALSRGRTDKGIIFLMCLSWPVLAFIDVVLPLGDIVGLIIWINAWRKSLSTMQQA
jgi:hypothetical protein